MQREKANSAASITTCINDYRKSLRQERRDLKSSLRRETHQDVVARLRKRLDEVESELQNLKTETLY